MGATFRRWSWVYRSLLGRRVGVCSSGLLATGGRVLWRGEEGWLGHRGRLARDRHMLSQLGNERNDSLYHPYKRLDLVGEIEECLDGDDRMPDIGTRRCSHLHAGEEGAALRVQGHGGQLGSPPRDAKWPCLAMGALAISSHSSSVEYVVQLYVKAEMSSWLDSIQVRMVAHVDRLNHRLVDRIEVNDSKPLLVS
ncbi:hypothetical protein B296_00041413 [Ensete ventricosum]|uniref:Uncharacterized protein n=1 Tax=Ensete ventricosum TaxID=4639 RepID=A0A426XLN0_ENSVE|nr:hypothetical protein B296_00041413 [Ensete ventricosum]